MVSEVMRTGLPLFITRQNRVRAGLGMFGIIATLYLISNHFPPTEPRLLPMTWIDRATPFLPSTVWIYMSEWLFFAVVYLSCRDMNNLTKYFYSMLALNLFSIMIFWSWPTTYPRSDFPLSPEVGSLTFYAFSWLRQMDTPNCCCPSLHVSSVYLSSFLFLDEQRSRFRFFFVWATLIALSTLTTKQHYLVDLVAGLGLASIAWWVFHRLIPYRSA